MDCAFGIVGNSPPIQQIRQQVQKLEGSRVPVLLLGESGTGKEVVARALHNSVGKGAFVPIDCGSLVGPLMESELFGHTRGSFTGATEAKKGLIELANGGTAFFDEIGDLPLDLQVKLLRLLQEKEYRAVGSLLRNKVDIRVISATHRDLAKEVEHGRFREDLYYRLNVVKLNMPPLRDRLEDIPLLVEHFLSRSGGSHSLTPEAIYLMMKHQWPGNVRELQNAIHCLVAMSTGPLLRAEDLPTPVLYSMHTNSLASIAAAVGKGSPGATPKMIRPLHEVEKQAIMEALEETKGDRGVAAALLGIGRTTLYRKLKEYSLDSIEVI